MTEPKEQQLRDRINQKLVHLNLTELKQVNRKIGRAIEASKHSKPIYSKMWFLALVVIFVILLLPLIYYTIHFANEQLGSKEDFAQFGDFLAGTSGVLMAFCNVFAFIYLTYTLAKTRDNAEDDKKNLQKKLNKINIQYDTYNKIIDLFATLVPPMTTDDYNEKHKEILKKNFNIFYTKFSSRMDSLGKAQSNPIFDSVIYDDFKPEMEVYKKFLSGSKLGDFDDFEENYDRFKEKRDEFLSALYAQIDLD